MAIFKITHSCKFGQTLLFNYILCSTNRPQVLKTFSFVKSIFSIVSTFAGKSNMARASYIRLKTLEEDIENVLAVLLTVQI